MHISDISMQNRPQKCIKMSVFCKGGHGALDVWEMRLVDTETGLVKHKKITKAFAHFREDMGYLFWNRKSFAKTFQDIPYPKEMTHAEIGQMAVLAKHIWS